MAAILRSTARSTKGLATCLLQAWMPSPGGATRAASGSQACATLAAASPALQALHASERCASSCAASSSGSSDSAAHRQLDARPHTTGLPLGLTTQRGLVQTTAGMQQQAVKAAEAADPALSLRERLEKMPTGIPANEALSMKAQFIFETCWKKMEQRLNNTFVCPREVIWLNGAPGSGKGTNINWIMKSRGLSRAIGMSQLLDSSPEIRAIIDKAELVPDDLVLDALLDAVLNPDLNDGAGLVIDGFPRTATQVDFVKLLHDQLLQLHMRAADGPDEWRFPRPSFKVVILYVDEEESVQRQTRRAKLASLHNKRVLDAGTGDVWNVRTTDVSEALCRRRYQVFKAHYSTILRLKSYFPFSLIDAMGTLEECRAQIVRELRYQSSLDLDARTYAAIRHLPLARDLVRVARQRLVFRLDSYCKRHYRTFVEVIKLIDTDVLPLLKQCSLAGHAEFRSTAPLLMETSLAVDMLIDVLTDRGFSVAHTAEERMVPERFNLTTGEVHCRTDTVHCFRITFDKENVRDLSTPASVTTNQGEDVAIGTTWVPEHMRREPQQRVEEATLINPDSTARHRPRSSAAGELGQAAGAAASTAAAGAAAEEVPQGGTGLSEADEARFENMAVFLSGWDSMDHELNAATMDRQYGYVLSGMNDRED